MPDIERFRATITTVAPMRVRSHIRDQDGGLGPPQGAGGGTYDYNTPTAPSLDFNTAATSLDFREIS